MRDDTSLAYAAGLIDGEGCIHIEIVRGLYFNPRVSVGMTEPALTLLQRMQAEWGGTLYQQRKATARWAAAYTWHMTGDKAATFITAIYPFLRLKREQADVALRIWEVKQALTPRWGTQMSWTAEARTECRSLVEKMHELNRKGPAPAPIVKVA